MAKPKNGSTITRDGKLYARVQWTDENGKRKQKEKRADNKSHADRLIKQMLREIDDYGTRSLEVDGLTFLDLADHYKKHHAVPAKYANGRKIEGLRSLANVKSILETLKGYFGKKRLRSITYGDIKRFKHDRLNTPTIHDKPRSVTSVHRDLAVLRNMLNVAYREGWILKNPFNAGPPLIHAAFEKKRERVISPQEEKRLLAACVGRRAHLRPIIVMALETGMRRGEIITLTWGDIDFANKVVIVRAFNAKNQRERTMGITPLLEQELLFIYDVASCKTDDLVFGICDNFKKAFAFVRKEAELEDVRFHDLRHTFATRLIEAAIPQAEVSRLLGHSTTMMTDRYINADLATARRAGEALSKLRAIQEVETVPSTVN